MKVYSENECKCKYAQNPSDKLLALVQLFSKFNIQVQ